MQLIKAEDYFKVAVSCLEGATEDGKPVPRDLDKAERILNEILNFNVGQSVIIYTLASVYLAKKNYGLAIQLLTQITNKHPTFGEAWNNLGLAWKEIPNFDMAEMAMKHAIHHIRSASVADIFCNLAALKITRNTPEECIKYSEQALKLDPGHKKALWHKGLALLEMRKWDEAWDLHEMRLNGGAPEGEIAHRNYHGPDGETPLWDGKSPGVVVIHGEQGLGDEIMFASCIPDALKVEGCSFIIEPSPRLEGVFRRAFPQAKVFGTDDTDGRLWIKELGKPDYKVALGSLPRYFRRDASAFPGTSYLVPDPGKRAWWGDKLKALGPRPNIGITWQGGVQQTRYDARSFHPSAYRPLFETIDANWISLQYDSTAQLCVNEVKEQLGIKISHWPKAVEQRNPETGKLNDIDELVALISKLDCVVTVCQTAVHIAGALGVPVICLTPSEPSWRYSAGDYEDMPWYSSVKQIRQERGTKDWTPVIDSAAHNLSALLTVMKAAESA